MGTHLEDSSMAGLHRQTHDGRLRFYANATSSSWVSGLLVVHVQNETIVQRG
jgi:hypothetical protein